MRGFLSAFHCLVQVFGFLLLFSGGRVQADWVILYDGTEVPCLVHEKEMPKFGKLDPEEIGVEIGRTFLVIQRDLIRDFVIDPTNYTPPTPDQEAAAVGILVGLRNGGSGVSGGDRRVPTLRHKYRILRISPGPESRIRREPGSR